MHSRFKPVDFHCSDARAVMERSIKANQDGTADADSGKVYRGQAAYKSYIAKKESQIGMNKYTGCVVMKLVALNCIRSLS
ncbi:unnamed protein product [Phytophthora fragariaefolia]|uniref:Unnamed protein product n=1 Tax=Phytophthora fragariaefolia TaxID=1490495 RepID=A0A9W6XP05_9STRA|nr:unnamed protein product [Phytophthora fragariaefolia]